LSAKLKPYQQMIFLDFVPRLHAMFQNQDLAKVCYFYDELYGIMEKQWTSGDEYAGGIHDVPHGHATAHFASFFDNL
jgi:hypothetical protein